MSGDIVTRLRDRHATTWHSGALPSIFGNAADEIERLRAENSVWRNGVADAVEPLGFDREAACGPADLLPGLTFLVERLAEERRWCDSLADVLRIVKRDWCPTECEVPVLESHRARRAGEVTP